MSSNINYVPGGRGEEVARYTERFHEVPRGVEGGKALTPGFFKEIEETLQMPDGEEKRVNRGKLVMEAMLWLDKWVFQSEDGRWHYAFDPRRMSEDPAVRAEWQQIAESGNLSAQVEALNALLLEGIASASEDPRTGKWALVAYTEFISRLFQPEGDGLLPYGFEHSKNKVSVGLNHVASWINTIFQAVTAQNNLGLASEDGDRAMVSERVLEWSDILELSLFLVELMDRNQIKYDRLVIDNATKMSHIRSAFMSLIVRHRARAFAYRGYDPEEYLRHYGW